MRRRAIQTLKVDYNSIVHVGDVLAILDPAAFNAALHEADAVLREARAAETQAEADKAGFDTAVEDAQRTLVRQEERRRSRHRASVAIRWPAFRPGRHPSRCDGPGVYGNDQWTVAAWRSIGDDRNLSDAVISYDRKSVSESAPQLPVSDNRAESRFEVTVDGHTAVLIYERTARSLVLVHTEVPDALRGRHIGDALVEGALAAARAEGLRIVAVCPFVKAYLRKHPPAAN